MAGSIKARGRPLSLQSYIEEMAIEAVSLAEEREQDARRHALVSIEEVRRATADVRKHRAFLAEVAASRVRAVS